MEKNKKKVSVKDIAEIAGTSVATVSRVINRKGKYSREMEQRVLSVIEEYGYEPNQLARGLRAKKMQTIGILIPDIKNEYYATIVKAVQKEFLTSGYMSVICSTNENSEDALKYVRMLKALQVDGIMYIGNSNLSEVTDLPTVYVDRDPRDLDPDIGDDFALIECDNIQGGYLAGQKLIEKGATNVHFMTYWLSISTHRKRLMGFEKAMRESAVTFSNDQVTEVKEVSFREGYLAMKKILEDQPDVDGVFCATDQLALGAVHYLNEVGISIPDQVKIIGFDDLSFDTMSYPPLTTIRQPIQEMADTAVMRMLEVIDDPEKPQNRQRLPVELVARGTT